MLVNHSATPFFIITNGVEPAHRVDGIQYITTDKPLQHGNFKQIIGSDEIVSMPISQNNSEPKNIIPNILRYDYRVIGYIVGCKVRFKAERGIKRMSKKSNNELRKSMFSAALNSF